MTTFRNSQLQEGRAPPVCGSLCVQRHSRLRGLLKPIGCPGLLEGARKIVRVLRDHLAFNELSQKPDE